MLYVRIGLVSVDTCSDLTSSFIGNSHRELGGEDTALLVCGWNPLDSVNTILMPELAICGLAVYQCDDPLERFRRVSVVGTDAIRQPCDSAYRVYI